MADFKDKLLPENFEDLLAKGDLESLIAVFDAREVDALGGHRKQAALAFATCSDDLTRWLLENGADISVRNKFGQTPLHCRATRWNGNVELLLSCGADVSVEDNAGNTPLHAAAGSHRADITTLIINYGAEINSMNEVNLTPLAFALQQCSYPNIVQMSETADALLKAGATKTIEMEGFVSRIGTNFELHRNSLDQKNIEAMSAALDTLYRFFDVVSVTRHCIHDGRSQILAKPTCWQERHEEFTKLLVPSDGPAPTAQGEVIRISGMFADELERDGALNWNAYHQQMVNSFLRTVKSVNRLSIAMLFEAKNVAKGMNAQGGDAAKMCELAVNWVELNPDPIQPITVVSVLLHRVWNIIGWGAVCLGVFLFFAPFTWEYGTSFPAVLFGLMVTATGALLVSIFSGILWANNKPKNRR